MAALSFKFSVIDFGDIEFTESPDNPGMARLSFHDEQSWKPTTTHVDMTKDEIESLIAIADLARKNLVNQN